MSEFSKEILFRDGTTYSDIPRHLAEVGLTDIVSQPDTSMVLEQPIKASTPWLTTFRQNRAIKRALATAKRVTSDFPATARLDPSIDKELTATTPTNTNIISKFDDQPTEVSPRVETWEDEDYENKFYDPTDIKSKIDHIETMLDIKAGSDAKPDVMPQFYLEMLANIINHINNGDHDGDPERDEAHTRARKLFINTLPSIGTQKIIKNNRHKRHSLLKALHDETNLLSAMELKDMTNDELSQMVDAWRIQDEIDAYIASDEIQKWLRTMEAIDGQKTKEASIKKPQLR